MILAVIVGGIATVSMKVRHPTSCRNSFVYISATNSKYLSLCSRGRRCSIFIQILFTVVHFLETASINRGITGSPPPKKWKIYCLKNGSENVKILLTKTSAITGPSQGLSSVPETIQTGTRISVRISSSSFSITVVLYLKQ